MTYPKEGLFPVLRKPPYKLDPEFLSGSDEVLASLRECPWLFPPASGTSGPDHGVLPGGLGAPDVGLPRAPEQPPEPPMEYEFTYLRSEAAQDVIRLLLAPTAARSGSTVAVCLGSALGTFVGKAFEVLTAVVSGRQMLPENERAKFVHEAGLAVQAMVKCGRVKVETDFIFCLEAFGVSKGRPPSDQEWLASCLVELLRAGAIVAQDADVARCKEALRWRIAHEARELYGSVDVRSWPKILAFVEGDSGLLDDDAFRSQVRLQLCIAGAPKKWYDGLKEAASLIANLRKAESFGTDELCEIFNDKLHFKMKERQGLLCTVLQKAPREITRDVLRKIDGEDVDISEFDDEEIVLVRSLIQHLGEDIRCCKHAFFKMKEDWISGYDVARRQRFGVVFDQEMTPDQVCDHIEDEDNHEELLKAAVNVCRKQLRKFEAARMLSRPASKMTRTYDNNRNDRELSYLISIYQELQPPRDQFGPVEQSCLVLPCAFGDVLCVEDAGPNLAQLERELLESGQPLVLGVWWFWRCFDMTLDLWPRASIMVLAYRGRLAIVDFMKLESSTEFTQLRGKDVARRILEAPHLLKVVHGLNRAALQALQRAVVPPSELVDDNPPPLPGLTPLLDVAVIAAYLRRSRPMASVAAHLTGLTFGYLRLELCMGENLSNWERRPLRLSQQHFALTLAWCPLMILHALCAFRVLTEEEVGAMMMRAGHPDAPTNWEDLLVRLSFAPTGARAAAEASEGESALEMVSVPGDYARDLWGDADWVRDLAPPERDLGALAAVRDLLLPAQEAAQAQQVLPYLFSQEAARQELTSLYAAYNEYQQTSAVGVA